MTQKKVIKEEGKDNRGEKESRDSSVGITTGYGLDDQGEREFQCR
jgi:hypothetical protein